MFEKPSRGQFCLCFRSSSPLCLHSTGPGKLQDGRAGRTYVGPVFEQEETKLPAMWRGSVTPSSA